MLTVLQQVVYSAFEMVKLELPYIAGFLAFREVGFLLRLVNQLRETYPELMPQVFSFVGQHFCDTGR